MNVDSVNNDSDENLDLNVQTLNEAKMLLEYTFTLSRADQNIVQNLFKLDANLECLMFKLGDSIQVVRTGKTDNSDMLNRQAKMSDFISVKLNEKLMERSIRKYPLERKMADLRTETKLEKYFDQNVYDPVFLLPNMFALLDYCKCNFYFDLMNSIGPSSIMWTVKI